MFPKSKPPLPRNPRLERDFKSLSQFMTSMCVDNCNAAKRAALEMVVFALFCLCHRLHTVIDTAVNNLKKDKTSYSAFKNLATLEYAFICQISTFHLKMSSWCLGKLLFYGRSHHGNWHTPKHVLNFGDFLENITQKTAELWSFSEKNRVLTTETS